MFDHITLKVRDFKTSAAFYRAVLAELGHEPRHFDEAGRAAGFGAGPDVALWIQEGTPPSSAVHLAFRCRDRASVANFHRAALRAGGADHGQPGIRADYASDYYAAFVLDPDGNNIEAVAHEARRPVYYMGSYDIDDAARFRQYPPAVMALLPKYGGELLASDTSAHVVEGEARTMNAIIRFPSREAALGLYDDPAYQEAKRMRQGSTSRVSMVLVEDLAR